MGQPQQKSNLQSIESVAGRAGSDTIRLWESYREQAFMWRALALLQIPATLLAIATALIMYFTADTIIEVPPKPQPGHYSVRELPDSEFISFAQHVVNLTSSYQPHTARRNFSSARKFLWEPALSVFEKDMMEKELKIIEETNRAQLFFARKGQIKVDRSRGDSVVVRLPGVRHKLIGSRPLPEEEIVYIVKMTTIPRNIHNEYGIVIFDMKVQKDSY